MRLGQRLRSIRLSRNLTQAQLAKDLFSISYVSGLERGQIRPSLGALEQLASRLEVPLVELATEGDFDPHSRFLAVRSRETAPERHRQEADRALREAQIFTYQRKSDEAVTRLLGVERAHLTPRQTVLLELLLAASYNQ
jgi:transcriptional regulator with XRE-family HTH domain